MSPYHQCRYPTGPADGWGSGRCRCCRVANAAASDPASCMRRCEPCVIAVRQAAYCSAIRSITAGLDSRRTQNWFFRAFRPSTSRHFGSGRHLRAEPCPTMRHSARRNELACRFGTKVRRDRAVGIGDCWTQLRPGPGTIGHGGHCPGGGCHSSTLLPSGSMTHPNFPYSESSVLSRTLQPSLRSAWSRAVRSSTR
jgi:hypothetical protein